MRVCALILKIAINTMPLYERRFDTVANFAFELDVSKHIIVRVLQIKVNRFLEKIAKKYSADSRVKMCTANRTPSKIGGSQVT